MPLAAAHSTSDPDSPVGQQMSQELGVTTPPGWMHSRSTADRLHPDVAWPAVHFSKELHDDIAAGDITVTFRLWRRRQVKVGGRYRVGRVEIQVDSMDLVPFASISEADVRRAGEPDREVLRRRAAHAGPIRDETPVYRIAFHVVT
jgi:hypothetical protein